MLAIALPGVAYLARKTYEDNISDQEPVHPDRRDAISRFRLGRSPYEIYLPRTPEDEETFLRIAAMPPSNNWLPATLEIESGSLGMDSLSKLTSSTVSPSENATISALPHTTYNITFRENKMIALCEGPLPDDSLPIPTEIARVDSTANRRRIFSTPYLLLITGEAFRTTEYQVAIRPGQHGTEKIFNHFAHPEPTSRLEPMHALAMPPEYHSQFREHMKQSDSLKDSINLVLGVDGPRSNGSRYIRATTIEGSQDIIVETGSTLHILEIVAHDGRTLVKAINQGKRLTDPERSILVNPDNLVFPPPQSQEAISPSDLEIAYAQSNPRPTPRPTSTAWPTLEPTATRTQMPETTSPALINTLPAPTPSPTATPTDIPLTLDTAGDKIRAHPILTLAGLNAALWSYLGLRELFRHVPPPPILTNLRLKSTARKHKSNQPKKSP